jgi:hypothetical protein
MRPFSVIFLAAVVSLAGCYVANRDETDLREGHGPELAATAQELGSCATTCDLPDGGTFVLSCGAAVFCDAGESSVYCVYDGGYNGSFDHYVSCPVGTTAPAGRVCSVACDEPYQDGTPVSCTSARRCLSDFDGVSCESSDGTWETVTCGLAAH